MSVAAVDMSAAPAVEVSVPAWGAVYAMALCSFVLVSSEFMPVSLLSPIAHELQLTEGQAGQAISVSGLFAVLTSLSVSRAIGTLDRRHVLLGFTLLLIVSGSMVAFAPTYLTLMVGRALLGIAIGGFWSMMPAMVMRLVPQADVPKGLAIINGGNALAVTVAAPLGSFMGGLIGWRGAFFAVVPVAAIAIVWQALALPSLPALAAQARSGMMRLLRQKTMLTGLLGVSLLFTGQFALYTYLRPFLEQVTGVTLPTLSTLLLVIGVCGLVGTALIGRMLGGHLRLILSVLPAVMACVAVALALLGTHLGMVAALLAVWGLTATAAPVAWGTWLTRAAPDDVEAGGGLQIAAIQLAITLGAAVGGVVYDGAGPIVEFLGSSFILLLAALTGFVAGHQLAGDAE